uniref:DUF295 domain-containing protein n=1 Tax=Arundo donax TaxID=35708 RepID=A0A0A9BZU8_ARUDO
MPKRQYGGRGGGRTAKHGRQHHLYLIFDEWLWGYSIRKVDLSTDSNSDEAHLRIAADFSGEGAVGCTGGQRLPPAFFRLEAPRGLPFYFAAAFGTKIMAMHPMAARMGTHPLVPRCLVPVFDVRTRALDFSPRPKSDPTRPIYISVGYRLFALSDGSVELLCASPLKEPGGQCRGRSWHQLPVKPPFKADEVTSYAVHPDGRTIFFSTMRSTAATTFTFHTPEDTEDGGFVWKRRGGWILPFTGGAHFDCELNAWVGLSRGPDAIGYLCACDVVSANSDAGNWQWDASDVLCPTWKLSKEKLFSDNPVEKHVGATLVYMGGKSEFCLVQCICIEYELDDKRNYYLQGHEEVDVPCWYFLRLTTFSLKYDKNGDLTTGNSRRLRRYRVPGAATEFLRKYPLAFWL